MASFENLRKVMSLPRAETWKPRPRLSGEVTHTWFRTWKVLADTGSPLYSWRQGLGIKEKTIGSKWHHSC